MKRITVSGSICSVCIILLVCIIISGCAAVKIYSDSALTKEAGLRYYTLRPYLLVEYMACTDKGVKTSVVYMPDLSSPQYIVFRPGLGSNDIKMTFENSALKSYGLVSESQLPELFESFAAMLSKGAYAAQTFTSRGNGESEQPGSLFRLYEMTFDGGVAALREVAFVNDSNPN